MNSPSKIKIGSLVAFNPEAFRNGSQDFVAELPLGLTVSETYDLDTETDPHPWGYYQTQTNSSPINENLHRIRITIPKVSQFWTTIAWTDGKKSSEFIEFLKVI